MKTLKFGRNVAEIVKVCGDEGRRYALDAVAIRNGQLMVTDGKAAVIVGDVDEEVPQMLIAADAFEEAAQPRNRTETDELGADLLQEHETIQITIEETDDGPVATMSTERGSVERRVREFETDKNFPPVEEVVEPGSREKVGLEVCVDPKLLACALTFFADYCPGKAVLLRVIDTTSPTVVGIEGKGHKIQIVFAQEEGDKPWQHVKAMVMGMQLISNDDKDLRRMTFNDG